MSDNGSEKAAAAKRFGSASMQSVRSFLKGRSLPGTVRLARGDRTGAAAASGAIPPRPTTGGTGSDPSSLHPAVDASGSGATEGSTPGQASSQSRPESTAQPSGGASSVVAESNDRLGGGNVPPSSSAAEGAHDAAPKPVESRSMYSARIKNFTRVLGENVVDLEELRELAWSGCPPSLRADCWRLLLGYLPPNKDRRESMLARKRREYRDYLPQFYDIAPSERSEDETNALRQVVVDVPRTAPEVEFFHQLPIQKALQRILYIWGVRHPASGYVQGINDLVTPFLAVFLGQHLGAQEAPMSEWNSSDLSDDAMLEVEADSYWCLSKLLDGIQDHYTYAQPGIQRTVFHVKELVRRVDEPVAQHLDDQEVDFLQFSFRWVNCLLIREVPFPLAARLWDTYLAEGSHLKGFLVYIAAAFLCSWSSQLLTMSFQDIVMFLQRPATTGWGEADVESILARAYLWRASFEEARSHLAER